MATFYNQATLSYRNNTVNSNTVSGELVAVLSATKHSLESNYSTDDEITYVINITNAGTTAFSGLTLTDNLGSYTTQTTPALTLVPLTYVDDSLQYYVNGVLQTLPVITSKNPLTISGISVPAGGNASLLYKANVNSYAPPATGSTITNTVTITGSGVSSDLTAQNTINVSTSPKLAIYKSICPNVVSENGTVNYTFNILNYGNTEATALDNIIVTDTFNPILTNLSVKYNNTVWAPTTNYTYVATTGEFETVAGQITVPAATFTQDAATGEYTITPGVSTLTVTGTV